MGKRKKNETESIEPIELEEVYIEEEPKEPATEEEQPEESPVKTPIEKLSKTVSVMKKILTNQKKNETEKQQGIYSKMKQITIIRK